MFKTVVFYGLSALIVAGSAANAAENCDMYSVAPGDTLRLISEQYYGARDLSPIIYAANMDVIGENPNTIEIGMELSIPCRANMQLPQPSAFLALIGRETDELDDLSPRFLAKAGETPFIGSDGSGIIPDILAAAMRAGGLQTPLEIARPESTSDVLRVSTEPNALLSFPWIMPNCADSASLSPQSIYLCQNYSFSGPLYEITLGIFTRDQNPLAGAETANSFDGKTICVPQFHTADMLGQNGIAATGAVVVISTDFADCLAGLDAGNFDAFVADYQSFKTLVQGESEYVDIPAFAQKSTLHAIAYSQNPAALEALEMANAGLKQILTSGEWFGIVNQHISKKSY